MIHVDRNSVPAPSILLEIGQKEHAEAMEFFKVPYKERTDRQFRFRAYRSKEVRNALEELFLGKCAFCETHVIALSIPDIEHFRPKMSTVDLDGKLFPDHYWWLAFEWTNLYLSCQLCNRMKGSRFPIQGPRAEYEGGAATLTSEEPLLLDPCQDYPEEHLVFNEDGTVAGDTERGRVTIEVYGLNRQDLVELRRNRFDDLQRLYDRMKDLLITGEMISDASVHNILEHLQDYTEAGRSFAGMARQFVAQWREELLEPARQHVDERYWNEFSSKIDSQKRIRSMKERTDAFEDFRAYQKKAESYTLEDREYDERYFLRTRLIERVEIRNFRIIEDLSVKVPETKDHQFEDMNENGGDQLQQPWLMMLGENGTGKSAVLQAITLALVGEKYRSILGIKPLDVLRHGCKEGHVKVFLSASSEPITLRFDTNRLDFDSTSEKPKILLLAYGATRFLPRPGFESKTGMEYARVDNLFNPFIPLIDATEWLLSLPEESFMHVQRAIKTLLSLKPEDRIERNFEDHRSVLINVLGASVALNELSDGYQTLLALTSDIMAVMLDRWEAMEVAEGIVLLDEIGAHLHPRWQMSIVKSLRQVFPRVQFIVTTHSPLCLRGLSEGEVVVMRRTKEDKIVALTDLPSVEGLRVDQLLTSEHFGLDSTVDPEVDRLFKEYYQLIAKRDRTESDENQLANLKAQLKEFDLMGTTRREQIMLEAVDSYLAEQPELLNFEKRKDLKEETRRKILDVWTNIK